MSNASLFQNWQPTNSAWAKIVPQKTNSGAAGAIYTGSTGNSGSTGSDTNNNNNNNNTDIKTEYSGGDAASNSGLLNQILSSAPQTATWNPPSLPATPQVTPELIAQWIERAKSEASLKYDPTVLQIQQTLESMLQQAEASKSTITPAYNKSIENITTEGKNQMTTAESQWYSRGLGRGTGLVQEEGKIAAKTAQYKAEAEQMKNDAISQIEAQKTTYTKQAGEQNAQIETLRGEYISSRAADLQDSYVAMKTDLAQKQFDNEMSIAEYGLTKESQDFTNWLNTMTLAVDTNYKDQLTNLQSEAQKFDEWAQTTSLNQNQQQIDSATKASGGGTVNANDLETKVVSGVTYYRSGNNAWQVLGNLNNAQGVDNSGNKEYTPQEIADIINAINEG
jgi:hypothetical protein